MRYCNNCGSKLLANSKYCSECGKSIISENKKDITTGKGSINFIASDESKINTRDIYINPHKDSFEIDYEYVTYGKKIKVDTAEKVSKFATVITIISGIMTMITFFLPISIGTLTSISNNLKTILFIVTLFSCMVLAGIRDLLANKNLKLPLNIELKKINDKYISKIATVGECPICGGMVIVKKIKKYNKESGTSIEKYIGICEKNIEHKFTFDSSIFKGERIKE